MILPEMLEKSNMAAAFFETFVVSEIVKSFASTGTGPDNLFYFRTMGQKEIATGLVIDSCEKLMPINETAWYCPVSLL